MHWLKWPEVSPDWCTTTNGRRFLLVFYQHRESNPRQLHWESIKWFMVLIFYIWIFAAPFLACSFSVDNYLNDKHRFIATKLLACSFECQRDILRAQLKIFHYKLIWINWVCLTYLKSWHWLSSIKPKSQISAIFSRKSTIGLFLMCLT